MSVGGYKVDTDVVMDAHEQVQVCISKSDHIVDRLDRYR